MLKCKLNCSLKKKNWTKQNDIVWI